MQTLTTLCLMAVYTANAFEKIDAFDFYTASNVASGNPFQNTPNYYVNPNYQKELQSSIDTSSGTTKTYLQKMMNTSSAYWIDRKSVIKGTTSTSTMEGILKDAASKSTK